MSVNGDSSDALPGLISSQVEEGFVAEYEDDSSHRPNKWTGTAAEWRHLTSKERSLIESLERADDDNLSLHLYNAHAIKQSARLVEAQIRDSQSKQRWYNDSDWIPPREWTSWPDAYEYVPLETESGGSRNLEGWNQHGTIRMAADSRPSAVLESELIAVMNREVTALAHRNGINDPMNAGEDTQERSGSDEEQASVLPVKHGNKQKHPDDDMTTAVHLADEDQILRRLRPASRRLLEDFDRLLTVLNHSRRNNYQKASTTLSKLPDMVERESEGPDIEPIPQHRSPMASDSESSVQSISEAKLSSEQDDSEDFGDGSLDQQKQAPRDWSEILSAAAICGWDAGVLRKAQERCERIFNEHMRLAFDEPKDERRTVTSFPAAQIVVPLGHFACPHADCAGRQTFYEKRWRLNEHLKRSHGEVNPKEITATQGRKTQPSSRSPTEALDNLDSEDYLQTIDKQPDWIEGSARSRKKLKLLST